VATVGGGAGRPDLGGAYVVVMLRVGSVVHLFIGSRAPRVTPRP
jgi:hypothetical protein